MKGLDARGRILCALLLSVAVAVAHGWPAAWLGFAAGCAGLALSGPDWGSLVRRLGVVNIFFAGVVATVPLAVPGEILWRAGPLVFTREGLLLALLMTLKGNAIFLLLWGLVRPLSPPQLGSALAAMRVPGKLCLILTLTYRYLDLMRLEWRRLSDAAALRGFAPAFSVRTFRVFGLMLALLFLRALDRAGTIHQAMLCRGFQGRFKSLGGLCWKTADTALMAAGCLVALGVALLESA